MADWKDTIAELFYPWPLHCVCCGKVTAEESALCPNCLNRLAGQKPTLDFAPGELFSRSAAVHPYAREAGHLVRLLKYRPASALAEGMGGEMRELAALAGFPEADAATYVPMHWTRRRQRYFNQSELLARYAVQGGGLRPEKLLRRVRRCRQQAKLHTPEAREANVRGAFRATRPLDGLRVLLIDDVYTTGATAKECARALRDAGAAEVLLLVYSIAGTFPRTAIEVEKSVRDDV